MIGLQRFLEAMHNARVDFIVIGGIAARMHGSARITQDVDVVYAKSDSNIRRLVGALAPYKPYLRGAPRDLPFTWDAPTVKAGLNFTLTTTIGDIDVLGEVAGAGRYEDLLPLTISVEAFGFPTRVVTIAGLIRLKRAVGRVKDYEAIAELEILLELGEGTH